MVLLVPGFLFNNLILGKKRTWESIALSWISGGVLFTLGLYVCNNLLNVRLNLINSWVVLILLTILLFVLNMKTILNINKFSLPEKIKLSKYEKILVIVILSIVVLAFITSFFFPVADWDAITVFDFRAKSILEFGRVNSSLFSEDFFEYPFYTTLLHFWGYLNGLWTAMPIYPLFITSLAAGIYFVARRTMSFRISLLLVTACIFAPRIFSNSFIAYANLPYTVLLILGAIYIYAWTKKKNYRDLILGVLLSSATFWVRSFPFAIINFSLLFLAIPFFNKISKYLAVVLLLLIVSLIFIPNFSGVANYINWSVYKYYFPFCPIFIGLFIFNFIKRKTNWFLPLLYMGYGLIIFVGTYIFEKKTPGYYFAIPDALQRMTMFVNLVVIWFLAETHD